MRRGEIVPGVVGVLGCLLLLVWPAAVMPAYLAAWLFWMSLPLGALPLVAAAELLRLPDGPMLAVLRRMLLLLPPGALLAVPLMLAAATLFHSGEFHFLVRMVVMLLVWCGLALLLSRPRRGNPRSALGGLALVLHVALESLAAFDWVMSLGSGLFSSSAGLLLIAGQVGVAACAALVVMAARGKRLTAAPGLLVAGLLGAWAFLHFTQYLVIWSANLPAEIVWYQQRETGAGSVLIWAEAAVALLTLVLLPSRLGRRPALAAGVAALLLLGHAMETLWLVTPAFRGTFGVQAGDLVAVVGLGGLSLSLLSAVTRGSHDAI